MTRVDELEKKYPTIPRQFIIRWDTMVHGLRDTGKLDEFGRWVRLAGVGTYASYDHDITLKDWVEARPGRQKPGYILRPGKFILPHSRGLEIDWNRINTKSDLEVRSEGNGKFALYQGDERVEELLHLPPKAKRENLTSTGRLEFDYFTRVCKDRFLLTPVRHCEYFPLGLACKFCNFNPSQDDARSIGFERPTTVSPEETLEVYKMFAADTRIAGGGFELGGFTRTENEVRLHANFMEKMAAATSYKPEFHTTSQPLSRKDMQRLKDVGLDWMGFQMEIWDPDLFPVIVPGKARYCGRDRYLEAFQEAVDVFGFGNARCVFVGGVSMIPENGHKTWQEARDSTVEGVNWMIKRGMWILMTALRLPPGSPYASEENRMKAPPTEYYLQVELAEEEACQRYGLTDKFEAVHRRRRNNWKEQGIGG